MPRMRVILWAIVVLFALETAARILAPALVLTALNVALLVAFALIHGGLRYGARGITAFVVICLVVSNIFENLSILTGFPFGHYHYTEGLGPKLFLVPLLIGPAYLGVGYIAWTIGTLLVGDVRASVRGASLFWAPFIAAFIMVLWDVSLDPSASTIGQLWIWENGGGFFGVPLSNYLGWFLTVYVFLQLFALYVRATSERETMLSADAEYFLQAVAMYAVVGAGFVLQYAVGAKASVTDATGAVWQAGSIYETAAMTGLMTMGLVVALGVATALRLPRLATKDA
jgi:putative membrane protein